MFVQKKYPKVEYTIHIELTEEEVKKLVDELAPVGRILDQGCYLSRPERKFPNLYHLLGAIHQESLVPPRC